MGGGSWTVDTHTARTMAAAAAGRSTFDYHETVERTGKYEAHSTLNPKGVGMRESRDSAEHPDSQAIAILFDVTGSMREIPKVLREKLPGLLGLLLRKGYVADPQILFAAIGDATSDRVPLQVGQFESDNRMDENLENFFLEGGGGGGNTESYELAMYFLARHTALDCFEKRGKRGYAFFIGDERPYPAVKRREVEAVIGDIEQEDINTVTIAREMMEKYEVYCIIPTNASKGRVEENRGWWKDVFGQNVIFLDDAGDVAETIAMTIGLAEGSIDLGEGAEHLKEIGATTTSISSVTTALSGVPVGAVAKASGGALEGLAGSAAERI